MEPNSESKSGPLQKPLLFVYGFRSSTIKKHAKKILAVIEPKADGTYETYEQDGLMMEY